MKGAIPSIKIIIPNGIKFEALISEKNQKNTSKIV
jgi:hypothetical protein